MKPATLSLLAVVLGSAAIALALTRPKPMTQVEIQALVDEQVKAALAEREQALCDHLAPRVGATVNAMGRGEISPHWFPRTVEDLLAPLLIDPAPAPAIPAH